MVGKQDDLEKQNFFANDQGHVEAAVSCNQSTTTSHLYEVYMKIKMWRDVVDCQHRRAGMEDAARIRICHEAGGGEGLRSLYLL